MAMALSRSGRRAAAAASVLILLALAFHQFGAVYLLGASLRAAGAAIAGGYRAAPALMLGLALAIGFPLLTIASRILREVRRSPDATRRYRPGRDGDWQAELAEPDPPPPARMPFIEIESRGKGIRRCAIPRDMLRIGREDDNDIRIRSGAVHRYHAAIYREDYDDWHIADLSGVEGNGLSVNGRPCCEARLNDGDLIQLGPGRLRFRAGSG